MKLVDHPGSYDSAPNWSPDGKLVAFESNVDGDMEIYVMDSDGANIEKLTDTRRCPSPPRLGARG